MIENPKSKDPLVTFFLGTQCQGSLKRHVRFANRTNDKNLRYGRWVVKVSGVKTT